MLECPFLLHYVRVTLLGEFLKLIEIILKTYSYLRKRIA